MGRYISKHVGNLRPIRRSVSINGADNVHIRKYEDESAKLEIRVGITVYMIQFASFTVLCGVLLRWRNLSGVPLSYNDGQDCGIINSKNEFLKQNS